MLKSCDLSFKWKILTLLIVIPLCIGLFELRVFDFIAVPIEHLTIMRGDKYKKKSDDEQIHKFYDDRISVILIRPDKTDSEESKEQTYKDYLTIEDQNDKDYCSKPEQVEAEDKWRNKYPAIVEKLTEVGARVIVFDIGFGRDMGESDIRLIHAIQQAKKRGTSVIIPFAQLKKNGDPFIADKFKDAVGNKGYGLASGKSRFGVTVKTPLAIEISRGRTEYYYSLFLRAVEAYWGGKIIDIENFESCQVEIESNNNICQKHTCRFFDSKKIDISYCENNKLVTILRSVANLFIDTSEIPDGVISEYEDIKNIFETDDITKNTAILNQFEKFRKSFNSKIVIIGKTDDVHKVSIEDKRPGALVQADAINTVFKNIENNKSIRPLLRWFEYVFIIIFGLYAIILNSYISWWKLNMSCIKLIFLTSIVIVMTFISCFEFSFRLYIKERILMNWIYHFITFLLILSAGWIKRFVSKRSIHEQNS